MKDKTFTLNDRSMFKSSPEQQRIKELILDKLKAGETDSQEFSRLYQRSMYLFLVDQIDQADEWGLIIVLELSARLQQAMPDWAAVKIQEAIRKVSNFEVSSWDEVFEKPLKKGQHRKVEWEKKSLTPIIRCLVQAKHLDEGQPLDDGLFEAVAGRVGVSRTKVKELYYALPKAERETHRLYIPGLVSPPIKSKIPGNTDGV